MNYHELHKDGIGSAEIAAVCGWDPYLSRLELWERKRAVRAGETVEDNAGRTVGIKRGEYLEPGVRAWASEELGCDFIKPDFAKRGLAEVRGDGLATTGFGLTVLEIKCPSPMVAIHHWGEDGTGADGVPPHVVAQGLWQVYGYNADAVLFAALIGGELRRYLVRANHGLIEAMTRAANDFWNCVETGTRPRADVAASSWLDEHYPRHNTKAELLESDADSEPLAKALVKVRADRKRAEEEEERLKNELKAIIGEAPGLSGGWGKIYWKNSKDSERVSTTKLVAFLEEHHPELLADFRYTQPGPRSFRVYPKK